MMLITKCVSFSDDVANTLLLVANKCHANFEKHQIHQDPNLTYQVQVTRPHTTLAAKILEDIIEDATDDENEVRFSDVYMDKDGNSIDSSGASDSDDEVTETQSNCSDEVLQRDGSYSHIMKQNVFNFLQETDMSPDKNLAVSLMTDNFMALHEGVDDRYVAPSLLITGGPGLGNHFWLMFLMELQKE